MKLRNLIASLLAAAVCCLPAEPQLPKESAPGPVSKIPPTTLLRKTVAYLTTTYMDGPSPRTARGTAFFVRVTDPRLPPDSGFVYLVSNRHMAEPGIENGKPQPVTGYTLATNQKSSGGDDSVYSDALPVSQGSFHWYFPSDGAVDLAIYPVVLDPKHIDYESIPLNLFETKDKVAFDAIAEGSPVLFTGFFYQFPGNARLQPIVRQGTMAMMPSERMTTTLHQLGDLYLADMHVFGGNSGSPAFVDLVGFQSKFLSFDGFPYRLIGVVCGYLDESPDGELTTTAETERPSKSNSGVASIVPADALKDLLLSPALAAMRELTIKQYLSAHP